MTSLTLPAAPAVPAKPALPGRERLIAIGSIGVSALVVVAVGHRLIGHGDLGLHNVSPWLVLHLATVIPAMPLGAYILLHRKGGATHRMLGRVWCLLVMLAALSSFGLHELTGHLSWIHILSAITIVGVPRAIWAAMRGNIAKHRRGMTIMSASIAIAGLFAFLPGRLFGQWLFG